MADRTYRWLLVTLAVIGLSADQISKYGMFRWLYRGGEFKHKSYDHTGELRTGSNEYVVVPDWFEFTAQYNFAEPPCDCGLQTWSAPVRPHVNYGALFGIGGDHKGLANGIFAAVSVTAAIAIIVWGTRRNTSREKGLMAALGLILGGTIGNLYDRLVFGGVRDFMHFHHNSFDWPVFNVADCCLVVGAVLLLIQAVFVAPKPQEADVPEDEAVVPAAPQA